MYARSLLGTPFNSTLGDALEKENCELKCSRKKSTKHSLKVGRNTTEQALSSHATSNYMQEWAIAAPPLCSLPVASGTPMCRCLRELHCPLLVHCTCAHSKVLKIRRRKVSASEISNVYNTGLVGYVAVLQGRSNYQVCPKSRSFVVFHSASFDIAAVHCYCWEGIWNKTAIS